MVTTTSSDAPTFVLPNGETISADLVEADPWARITTCEEALEVAVWQLARFYSAVWRYEEATACVERGIAGTQDPAKHGAVHLRLGQLLKQRDWCAEGEAVYARGLEFPSASTNVSYLPHKHRGSCPDILGRHAEAEFHCGPAVGINPRRHNAHKNLGLAPVGQKRYGEGARSLLEADRR